MATIASQGFVLPANPPRPCQRAAVEATFTQRVTVVWKACK